MKQANPHLAARRARKAALLPQVVQLVREGLTYQEIAEKVGLAKSTICQWLRGRPLEQAAKTLGTPRMTAKLAKRYESLYQKAIREWARSKTDREIRTVETIAPAGGGPTTKTTVRTEPRIANAACLGKALAAMKATEGLHYREQRRLEIAAEFGRGPVATDRAADEDAHDASPDEESLTRTEEDTDRTTERIIAALDAAGRGNPKSQASTTRSTGCPETNIKHNEEVQNFSTQDARAPIAWYQAAENAHVAPADEDTAADPPCQEDAALPASEVDSSNEELQTLAELRSQALAILDARRLAAAEGSGMDLGGAKGAGKAIQHVGRNAPCPCGSGKKFKKCCIKQILPSDAKAGSPADAARLVNTGTPNRPRRRHKPLVFKNFELPNDDFSTVFRSATLVNDLAQKGGGAKGQKKPPKRLPHHGAQGSTHNADPLAAELTAPRGGSSGKLMQVIERVLGDRIGLGAPLARDAVANRYLKLDDG